MLTASLQAGAQIRKTGKAVTWQQKMLAVPYAAPKPVVKAKQTKPVVRLVKQDFERLEVNQSIMRTPLKIGTKDFEHGLGSHSKSEILVNSPIPIEHFSAWIGADNNGRTAGGMGSVTFSVAAGDSELYRSGVFRGAQEGERIDVDTKGTKTLRLLVGDADDGPICDHADWADATITLAGGKTMRLDELEVQSNVGTARLSRYPFSFTYAGKPSDDLLPNWTKEQTSKKLDADRTQITTSWTDPATGLKVYWEVIRYSDFSALDWLLYFKNTGKKDTQIIENVQALNVVFDSPLSATEPYRLHRTNGDPTNQTSYTATTVALKTGRSEVMGGTGGQSSRKDFPFFRIESGDGCTIVGVGWGGQWLANLTCPDNNRLQVTTGLELTHFKLHPGERVRSPRVLLIHWKGETVEANNQCRRLIYKHYTPTRFGKKPLPTLFCNTCYTRFDGGWLNECNAENQISLIKAYGKLGLEALVTDAGWFEGGWPSGAGNWNPRKDAYPDGMAPVALAAKENGMVYGLWFEPERVVAGTALHKEHPDWCLGDPKGGVFVLNFGLPEAQDYFFNIVKGFMDLPGFRFYRQDHNIGPLAFWRYNDTADRQGVTEMKYFEGLYAYWDRLAQWPDSFREECAGGGGRIDLETIKRFHVHQKSDYNFDYETNQQTLWGLGQYMPNNTFVVPLKEMDDYAFHSNMASSLLLAWIADAPDFDFARGKKLADRYRSVRHLLIGDWYGLTPSGHDLTKWYASQYHRPDLNEGMLIVCRRPESPDSTMTLKLRGLDPKANYELSYDSSGKKTQMTGAALMKGLEVTIPQKRGSDLIQYRRL
jgi:alpha-galactosidase